MHDHTFMTWTAHIDGASRGNPGPAAAGVQITDDTGRVVFAGGFSLRQTTNNQAEYRALLAALDLLHRARADSIRIVSDSELMVRQITGRYRVKSPDLTPLFENARQRLARFAHWQIEHAPRTQNTRADQLANKAMDADANVVVTDQLGLLPGSPTTGHRAPRPPGRTAGPVVQVRVTRGPGRRLCPAGVKRGQSFTFTDTTPAGLCVDACAAVIDAVLALRDADPAQPGKETVMTPRCRKPGCGAVFEVRLTRHR